MFRAGEISSRTLTKITKSAPVALLVALLRKKSGGGGVLSEHYRKTEGARIEERSRLYCTLLYSTVFYSIVCIHVSMSCTWPGTCSGASSELNRPKPPSSEDPHVKTCPNFVSAAVAIPPHDTAITWAGVRGGVFMFREGRGDNNNVSRSY